MLAIAIIAFLAAMLTFFSGFGLGTILLPAFAFFVPLDMAVALTAIVHLLNNLFKFALVYKHIDYKIVRQFGSFAVISAFIGAFCLNYLDTNTVLYQYSLNGNIFDIVLLKLVMAAIMLFFALYELVPSLRNKTFDTRYLPVGGILSGFFGGLSGHQGALRSAFLLRANLEKQAFIATGVAIACLIDFTRLAVYSQKIQNTTEQLDYKILVISILAAFAGSYFGSKFIEKITIARVQISVAILLIIFALFFAACFIK
jgi:uncharacterized protein